METNYELPTEIVNMMLAESKPKIDWQLTKAWADYMEE